MSIQRQLTLLILAAVTLATFFAGLYGYKSSAEQLDLFFDKELKTYASFLRSQANQLSPEIESSNQSLQFQVWQQGEVITKSSNIPTLTEPPTKRGFYLANAKGQRWRFYSEREGTITVVVAQLQSERLAAAESVLINAVAPLVVALPIIAFFVFYFIRKSLRPLLALSRQLDSKNSDDLTNVSLHNPPSELLPVVNHLNELLRRLGQAFVRERQLSANTAHELRTPLSVLNINIHNLQKAFYQGTLDAAAIVELQNTTERLGHVIEQIIALHRYTEENFNDHKTSCDIEQVLQQVISQNYTHIINKNQDIELNGLPLLVVGHEFALLTLFENILKNAIKYTPEQGKIAITVSSTAQSPFIDVTIDDSGDGVSEDDLKKLTDRFYRASPTQSQAGSGLGLSIAQHIVELHKGRLSFLSSPLGGLRVKVELNKPSQSDLQQVVMS